MVTAQLGIAFTGLTLILAITHYSDQLASVIESVPKLYYIAVLLSILGISLAAVRYADEPYSEIGVFVLVALWLAFMFAVAGYAAPRFATYVEANSPEWPESTWLAVSLAIGVGLAVVGGFTAYSLNTANDD